MTPPFLGLNDVVTSENVLEPQDRGAVLKAVTQFMDKVTDNFGVTDLTLQQIADLAGAA